MCLPCVRTYSEQLLNYLILIQYSTKSEKVAKQTRANANGCCFASPSAGANFGWVVWLPNARPCNYYAEFF